MTPLVAFSHLRWDFVVQRPQHLMTRLARHYRIAFVEEPLAGEGPPRLERRRVGPNLVVVTPVLPSRHAPFSSAQWPELRLLFASDSYPLHDGGELRTSLAGWYRHGVAWCWTPLAEPLIDEFQPRVVVYDCMDELSAFRFAPRSLLQRETDLLSRADLVFTGGPSLYRAKEKLHPAVHCFASSVDATHFGRAIREPLSHASHAKLPKPRFGFYGVIDERFDLDLIDRVAQARPDWTLVMAGPVMKIDAKQLPQHPNLHWIGKVAYEELPALLAGWDAAWLPFARNESTRFISPTKLLEYMAAERPIVSTAIDDVARPYGDVVEIADTPQAWIAANERLLTEGPDTRARRVARMREVVQGTSWDTTAQAMHELIEDARATPVVTSNAVSRRPLDAATLGGDARAA